VFQVCVQVTHFPRTAGDSPTTHREACVNSHKRHSVIQSDFNAHMIRPVHPRMSHVFRVRSKYTHKIPLPPPLPHPPPFTNTYIHTGRMRMREGSPECRPIPRKIISLLTVICSRSEGPGVTCPSPPPPTPRQSRGSGPLSWWTLCLALVSVSILSTNTAVFAVSVAPLEMHRAALHSLLCSGCASADEMP